MVDEVDRAQSEQETYEEMQRLVRERNPYQIPIGVPGECEKCGEESLRLIRGICARCRDKFNLP